MSIDRRTALKSGGAAFIAFTALASGSLTRAYSANSGKALVADPAGLLDLPEGFSYRMLSKTGKPMSDGFMTPGRPDGMACFPHPTEAGRIVLVRNHENFSNVTDGKPFGESDVLLGQLDTSRIYDPREGTNPFFGGTSNLVIDVASGEVVRDNLSLIGTVGNCAGGATPWGSWLTCEEEPLKVGESGAAREHGYVYEVPAGATGPVDPVPLKAMGRFAHEACSVDPASGIVYMTEDSRSGLFYRFIPTVPGQLAEGGKLQALAIDGWNTADTRNYATDWSLAGARKIPVGERMAVRWIDLDDVESPNVDLALRGMRAGAALFCRGEGLAYGSRGDGKKAHFFNCTEGGANMTGQVWQLEPGEGGASDMLTLIYESGGADTLDLCDNLAVSPWGDLIICEDGRGDNYLRGLTPDGAVYDFARNAHEGKSEFCGACFSPDGSTLFVNVQVPGFTYAITGPWESLRAG
ncbi:PhoX family protein [Qipengyuania sp. 6B39]|uniref:alkaline phosphatase PhoX n=1 Tax=Qipengyuania proteolytica TaxID=2867239 RepID=UPI001C88EEE0|nr:alkaline phosphatase PhoX [Qipengyuania proteolytica]MBX7494328.1 PhoX family protein [Qipengyuania proteolytica]